MPEQLKIIIDADVNSAIGGVKELSKVISLDFAKSTAAASTAAANLSKDVAASIQKINASLSSLKVTSLDVNVNTSTIDASIKSIQSKFAAITDVNLGVLADTTKAEAAIKSLISELATLKGSEIFIRANDSQALKAINEIEAELNSIVDKQIKVNIDTSSVSNASKVISGDFVKATETASAAGFNMSERFAAVTAKINASVDKMVAEALGDVNRLKTSFESFKPNFGVLSFDTSKALADIEIVKAKLNSINVKPITSQPITIPVDTTTAQTKLNTLSETIETLRGKAEAKKFFITTETDITKIAAYNKEIQKLEAEVRRLQNVGKKGFELFVVPNQVIGSVKNLTQSVAAFGGGVRTFIPPAVASFNKIPPSINSAIISLKNLEKQSATSGAATSGAFTKAYSGLRTLANIIPGIGIGGLIGLAATAVNELTQGFFDAAFGASKLDQAIDAAAGSINKESASVITMVKALQSGTLTSTEFKKVKAELIAQAPDFQKTFEGDKISIDASDKALTKYIEKLTTTVRVTAALAIVNDTLAKSIATIAKGGTTTVVEDITSLFSKLNPTKRKDIKISDPQAESLKKAIEQFKPENISKLIDDTFKKLGISFKDFGDSIDDGALKKQLAKIKADFEKFQTETISKARQFSKEFGNAFVVPDLEESFFKNKDAVFKEAKKLLSDVNSFLQGNIKTLKVKIPVQTDFELLPITEPTISQDIIDGFTKSFGDVIVPVTVIPDVSIDKGSIDAINKKLDLRKQFSIFGDLGFKEFNKINFDNINAGIDEATKRLESMMAIATTLQQSIGQGLTSAFNSVFDAVLEGKSVFKALGEAIKQLVVGTIKAVAQMLILKAVTAAIFPGGAGGGIGVGLARGIFGGQANFGQLSGIGSRAFQNVLTVNVVGNISGDTILLAGQRAANSQGRFG